MAEVAAFDFAGGTAAVFSTSSPNKLTPNEDVAAVLPTSTNCGILAVADGLVRPRSALRPGHGSTWRHGFGIGVGARPLQLRG